MSAAVRVGRWTKYLALAGVDAEWLAARRIPGRLGWPHQWKQRAAARAAAAPGENGDEAGGDDAPIRGESRARLRRAQARPETFSYDEYARKRARRTTAAIPQGQRKRKIQYMDSGSGRGRELRRMIQMGPGGIRAVEGGDTIA